MIQEILTAAGVLHRRARFPKPPEKTYAIFFDDVEKEGPDWLGHVAQAGLPAMHHHNVRIEVYEPHPDDATEAAIEAAMDARGLPWSKEDRYWLPDVQRYQVLYEFTYTTKN